MVARKKTHVDDGLDENIHLHDERLWNLNQTLTHVSTVVDSLNSRVETLTDTLGDIQESYRNADRRIDNFNAVVDEHEITLAKYQNMLADLQKHCVQVMTSVKYIKQIVMLESLIMGILLALIGIAGADTVPVILNAIKAALF